MSGIAVESACNAEALNDHAKSVAEKDLKEYCWPSSGTFRGNATKVAKLRLTSERALWVANETWHAQQTDTFEKDGSYVLEVPYHDHRKLMLDVLRHVAEVDVVAPSPLCSAVFQQADATLAIPAGKKSLQ